ncbi:MAG: DUF1501 domain-containing protein [Candidatus Scalindua sp.]
MKRRQFLKLVLATPFISLFPDVLFAQSQGKWRNLLILVELKGGNDGLNTVIPYQDNLYYQLRPRLAIARDQILQISSKIGLHPSMEKLLPIWQANELAIIQGVGYPDPNLSHFRSIEIWETGSGSRENLTEGWLSRLFAQEPPPSNFAADGVIIGSQSLGPLYGLKTRAIVLPGNDRHQKRSFKFKEGRYRDIRPNPALEHILKVERDYQQAAQKLIGRYRFKTNFPENQFGHNLKRTAQVMASQNGVAVIKISLGSFDTHAGQQNAHNRLVGQLAGGLAALRSALKELNKWDSTLVMTYSEFGRRPKENMSLGTDHGTANAHFMMGGKVKGGLFGQYPSLSSLDNGNLRYNIDFRSMYATVIEKWWGLDSYSVMGKSFPAINVI